MECPTSYVRKVLEQDPDYSIVFPCGAMISRVEAQKYEIDKTRYHLINFGNTRSIEGTANKKEIRALHIILTLSFWDKIFNTLGLKKPDKNISFDINPKKKVVQLMGADHIRSINKV